MTENKRFDTDRLIYPDHIRLCDEFTMKAMDVIRAHPLSLSAVVECTSLGPEKPTGDKFLDDLGDIIDKLSAEYAMASLLSYRVLDTYDDISTLNAQFLDLIRQLEPIAKQSGGQLFGNQLLMDEQKANFDRTFGEFMRTKIFAWQAV